MRTRLTVATVLLATLGMVGCAASSPGTSSVGVSTGTPGLAKGTQGTARRVLDADHPAGGPGQ